ncbi:MAG TPA: MBL fold metallo-hydrolase [Solirubrobacteraceae bacterium]|jgi:glyoxylase-like metal-dependent hydrolase (beta-lactamase superfamily II)|nr:MBL fold metallo-hydrolase [Solirubrobacteraceae bacterium]
MRAVALHGDVLVCWSRVWQTSCTAVRAGEEALVIDSPVYPDELELLPALVERAGFEVKGVVATHADWDHLLGRAAFPDAPLGCAETTAARLAAEPGRAQRELRDFDERHYVERARTLSLPAAQALPVPGYCEVGDRELELHPADGHTSDGMAVWIPWTATLVCGDYLSPVEIPAISADGSLDGYRATLERLRPLVERAEAVVPGHGPVLERERALTVLAEDDSYLEHLSRRGADAALPPGRTGAEQRRIHAGNADRLA